MNQEFEALVRSVCLSCLPISLCLSVIWASVSLRIVVSRDSELFFISFLLWLLLFCQTYSRVIKESDEKVQKEVAEAMNRLEPLWAKAHKTASKSEQKRAKWELKGGDAKSTGEDDEEEEPEEEDEEEEETKSKKKKNKKKKGKTTTASSTNTQFDPFAPVASLKRTPSMLASSSSSSSSSSSAASTSSPLPVVKKPFPSEDLLAKDDKEKSESAFLYLCVRRLSVFFFSGWCCFLFVLYLCVCVLVWCSGSMVDEARSEGASLQGLQRRTKPRAL
jgi:hypothetical protein